MEWENLSRSIDIRNVSPDMNTVGRTISRCGPNNFRVMIGLTEHDPLSEEIDVDAKKRRETSGEKEVETGDPSSDDSAFFQSLLSKLSVVAR